MLNNIEDLKKIEADLSKLNPNESKKILDVVLLMNKKIGNGLSFFFIIFSIKEVFVTEPIIAEFLSSNLLGTIVSIIISNSENKVKACN